MDSEISEIALSNIHLKGDKPKFQCIEFFFTYHIQEDDTFDEQFLLLESLKPICKKYVWAEEYGKSGKTPHIQGGFILKDRKRAEWLEKRFFKNGVSLFKLKTFEGCLKYCQKEGNKVISSEDLIYVKEIEELYKWQEDVLKIIEKEPNDRSIHWFWEADGCAGKTTIQKYIYTHFENAVVLSGKAADMKNGIIQLSKIPKIVMINIPRASLDFVSYAGIEEIKDMFFFSGKYEGGMVCGPEPHVIIFANEPPQDGKMSEDRWIVHNITEA
jgi:hypothetical protein